MRKITLFILLSISSASCIKEDLQMCLRDTSVSFSYTLNEMGTDLFRDEVRRIDLFAFDERGTLVKMWSDEAASFPNDYAINIDLPVGRYTLVAWGGLKTGYNFEHIEIGETTITQARLAIQADRDQTISSRPEALYFGRAVDVAIDNKGEAVNIELVKNTKNIRLTIRDLTQSSRSGGGASMLPDFEHLTAEITCSNGKYHFDNRVDPSSEQLTYKPYERTTVTNSLTHNYTTMRLMQSLDATLKLYDTTDGSIFYSCNLVDQIITQHPLVANDPTIGLDKYSDFQVDLEYSELTYTIYVTVNGWRVRLMDVSLD